MSWFSDTFKKAKHAIGKVGKAVGKTVKKVVPIATSVLTGDYGGALSGTVGLFGGSGSTVPEISQSTPSVLTSQPITIPDYVGGTMVYRDGTARNADGSMILDEKLASEIYGSPNKPYNDDSNSGATPLLFGLGALLLLSD